ncbi:MAG: KilA-N domain-containing protein [Arcicella sp.]|nr:KilA-N domain-containing protein [Arcicella sp.]
MIKSKANKGVNAGTWMHPILFIDFAMWINPKFKVKVLKFV